MSDKTLISSVRAHVLAAAAAQEAADRELQDEAYQASLTALEARYGIPAAAVTRTSTAPGRTYHGMLECEVRIDGRTFWLLPDYDYAQRTDLAKTWHIALQRRGRITGLRRDLTPAQFLRLID